ncbi:MAG TPA: 8-amino-7-oxononanoate synthase [Geobacteraceae bacterium]|nr:8-amino-7-oxononanoate synthase [Geobacteraceae bacterium]
MSFFQEELDSLRQGGLYRSMRLVEGAQQGRVIVDGREVLLLCSNNYLGLADHPLLKDAAIRAVEAYGVGSGAARLVSGNMTLHQQLEERLARFKGTESAILFNNGYSANLGIISALVGRGDTIYSDRLNHASIVDGALLSRAKLLRYPHNDVDGLRRLLESNRSFGRQLIVSDGVFSMDGDIARLQEISALKKEFGALLMVDDAHGTAVLGEHGRGSVELCGVSADVDIQMGTLGKGLGSFGAYVAGSAELIEYLRNRARSFIFSTSLPPAVLAASLAAIELVSSREGAELRKRLEANAHLFSRALLQSGFDTLGSTTQIVPVLAGGAEKVMEFSRRLLDGGLFVQGIRPPTVPIGSCRLRCTVMATHEPGELTEAAALIAAVGRDMGII